MLKTLKAHFQAIGLILLIILTFLMLWLAHSFKIDSFFDHPQFARFDYFNEGLQIICNSDRISAFRSFFYVDFIWAFLLLFLLGSSIVKWNKSRKNTGFLIYCIVAGLAYIFDVYENMCYLGWLKVSDEWIQTIVKIKTALYATGFFIFLLFLYLRKIHKHLLSIKIFLKTSYLSLLIIFIVIGLLVYLPQGGTIIVDLFYKPGNLIAIYLLLLFMSITLSHYPTYIEAGRYPDKIKWCMHNAIIPAKWLGWGLVTFSFTDHSRPLQPVARKLRHFLGLLILSAFLFALTSVTERYQLTWLGGGNLPLAAFIFFIWYYQKAKSAGRSLKINLLRLSGSLSIILMTTSIVIAAKYGWSTISVWSAIITTLAFMWFYISFRQARSLIPWLWETKNFVRIVSIFGFISLTTLFILNICIDWTVNYVHPLTILFLCLSNFYGILVIISKHIRFYNDKQQCNELSNHLRTGFFSFWKYGIPAGIVLIVLLTVGASTISNDLHTLPVTQEENPLNLGDFIGGLPSTTHDGDTIKQRFQVSSYGGGLKANLWNLLVFNELQKITNGDFIRSTISISTNSGGTIGAGNFALLWANHWRLDNEKRSDSLDKKIFDIGNFNHLAIDLTYLFGRDMIREIWPWGKYKGTDRSWEAMKKYAKLTGLEKLGIDENTTFRDTWHTIYNKSGEYYPALIVNTFSTQGRQGNAFSLTLDDSLTFNNLFPGSIDIQNKNASISYYGTLSTSNRFPIFSPTAHIRGKGHFLDGGYFDNSGISTSSSFTDFLKNKTDTNELQNLLHIIIDNDLNNYLYDILYDFKDVKRNEGAIGEISAIIQSLISLNKVPYYFEGKLQNNKTNKPIALRLPHLIKYDDILRLYRAIPEINLDTLRRIMQKENQLIMNALRDYGPYQLDQWGVVEPPLARLNSEPAIRYQEAMVKHHPRIRNKMRSVKEMINGTNSGSIKKIR